MSAAEPYTVAQARVIAAALPLFADHGVNGTSLQMIADSIGVTKAAVYHQFPTKEEAEPSAVEAREVLVTRIVDLAVARRRSVSVILSDPVIVPFFAAHEPFRRVTERLNRLLLGGDTGPEARVRTAMLMAAISGPGTHPTVVASTTSPCAPSCCTSPGGSSTFRTEPEIPRARSPLGSRPSPGRTRRGTPPWRPRSGTGG